jgi:hypothetical protein
VAAPDEHDEPIVAGETDEQRARRIAREAAIENRDPVTRREAIEQALDEAGLSDWGEVIGQHND